MDGDRSEVQRLYDACGAVFSPWRGGGLPTLTQIRWLQVQDILGTSHDLIVQSCVAVASWVSIGVWPQAT